MSKVNINGKEFELKDATLYIEQLKIREEEIEKQKQERLKKEKEDRFKEVESAFKKAMELRTNYENDYGIKTYVSKVSLDSGKVSVNSIDEFIQSLLDEFYRVNKK